MVAERMPDALKIGALASAGVAKIVTKMMESLHLPAPVLDPVLVSSSGTRLLDDAGAHILRAQLIPLAAIVTPNIPEAEVLSGIEIGGAAAMRRAAQALHQLGPQAVLIKGGHWPAPTAECQHPLAVDLYFDGRRFVEFAAPRIAGAGAHGTGCTLSAAIAALLARGLKLETAVGRAKRFTTRALKKRLLLGDGRYVLDHFAG
jgi:hydroxymethylpyrimidine/phosphomethylpyrimidine kinase